jgi:hypothetical protein
MLMPTAAHPRRSASRHAVAPWPQPTSSSCRGEVLRGLGGGFRGLGVDGGACCGVEEGGRRPTAPSARALPGGPRPQHIPTWVARSRPAMRTSSSIMRAWGAGAGIRGTRSPTRSPRYGCARARPPRRARLAAARAGRPRATAAGAAAPARRPTSGGRGRRGHHTALGFGDGEPGGSAAAGRRAPARRAAGGPWRGSGRGSGRAAQSASAAAPLFAMRSAAQPLTRPGPCPGAPTWMWSP